MAGEVVAEEMAVEAMGAAGVVATEVAAMGVAEAAWGRQLPTFCLQ